MMMKICNWKYKKISEEIGLIQRLKYVMLINLFMLLCAIFAKKNFIERWI